MRQFAHLSLWQLLTQVVPKPCGCGSDCMWKWVRTVIPYERREHGICQTCHSVLHKKEKTEGGEERAGGRRQRDRHREGERKQETGGKGEETVRKQ